MAEAKVLLAVLARGYAAEPVAADGLNFKTNFLTLLRQGSVRFRRHEQPLPLVVQEYKPQSAAVKEGIEAEAPVAV